MYTYDVTVTRVGVVRVTADSPILARKQAEETDIDAISWVPGVTATDLDEVNPFGTEG